MSKLLFSSTLLATVHAVYPLEYDSRAGFKDEYPTWAALFGDEEGQYSGFAWDPWVVTTEDGWELTMFRIYPDPLR